MADLVGNSMLYDFFSYSVVGAQPKWNGIKVKLQEEEVLETNTLGVDHLHI